MMLSIGVTVLLTSVEASMYLVPEVDTTHSDRVAVHCPLSPTQQPAHWHCDWSAVSAGLACTTASLRFKLQCPNCIGPGFNLT
jgi:hypothetical protein